MRIGDQVKQCVVFFGYPDKTRKGGIHCIGTGFLLEYFNAQYLITAKHLSHSLGKDPFLIRVNRRDGAAENLPADKVDWVEHPDPTVDVAAVPLAIENQIKYEADCLGQDFLFRPGEFDDYNLGVGNNTFTMGLFQLLTGEKRNLPMAHFGNIAMLPGDEKIPVIDWTDLKGERRIFVEGYLVESLSLKGLSGSPVFVIPELNVNLRDLTPELSGAAVRNAVTGKILEIEPVIYAHRNAMKLLGVWQGAWEAPPDEVLAAQLGDDDVRVPVGVGIVVPQEKIIEVLEMPKLKEHRNQLKKPHQPLAARADSVRRPDASLPATAANPTHREDFNSLLNAAVKKPEQED